MSSETIVRILGPSDALSRLRLENIAYALRLLVERSGGAVWAGWTDAVLRIRVQGYPLHEVQELLETQVVSLYENGRPISTVAEELPATPLPDIAAGEIPWGTVMREKLTKRLLKLLPEGAQILGNYFANGEEILAEVLGPPSTREVTWKRAKIAGATNRLFRLAWTDLDFNIRFTEAEPPHGSDPR